MTKLTPENKVFLLEEYPEYKGETSAANEQFFTDIMARNEFTGITKNQIRMFLVSQKIYKATNPRQAAKKNGRKKAEILSDLNELLVQGGVDELSSGMKLTIVDLENLIAVIESLI